MNDEDNAPTASAAPESEMPPAPKVHLVKRVTLEHGDIAQRQTMHIEHSTTAADVLKRAHYPNDGRFLVLHSSGKAFDPDMEIYDLVESDQVVKIVRHPDHPRPTPMPIAPFIGSHSTE